MFWTIVEICIVAAILLISVTEFFIPVLFNKPLFGSFRRLKATEVKKEADDSLPGEISRTREKVEDIKEEVKEVQEKVEEHYKTAEQLKEESDNLLK
jgi:peptidoglycan hydrolase CwlO-like protein